MLSSLLQVTQLVRVSARLYLNPSTVYHLALYLREAQAHPCALTGCGSCQPVGSL